MFCAFTTTAVTKRQARSMISIDGLRQENSRVMWIPRLDVVALIYSMVGLLAIVVRNPRSGAWSLMMAKGNKLALSRQGEVPCHLAAPSGSRRLYT